MGWEMRQRRPEARITHPVAGIKSIRRPGAWARFVVRMRYPSGKTTYVLRATYEEAWAVVDSFVNGTWVGGGAAAQEKGAP